MHLIVVISSNGRNSRFRVKEYSKLNLFPEYNDKFIVIENKPKAVNQTFIKSGLENSTTTNPGIRLPKALILAGSFPKHLQLTSYFRDFPKLD